MTRRALLRLLGFAPVAAMVGPQTLQRVPPSALQYTAVKFLRIPDGIAVTGRWMGVWMDKANQVLAQVDRAGQAWWWR